ncbi:hypothetical protein [Bacteroides sp. 519]|uniref:hypothetical protein n=1 Tax=Bacteroides sp. 519 TaxID=2302937 RepID=UPI0013D7F15F|nr:hypothetical protein [Bacteroides sp. 519]NDV57105.1 hypothetical protein [Bacteroides sp. 519]
MKVGEIEKLLEEFYEGKTTEEQEEALREYFETEEVPEQFKLDQKIFVDYGKVTKVDVPLGLESKLIKLIDEKAAEEKRFMVKNKTVFNWKRVGSIAAGVLLIVGLAYGIMHLRNGHPKDTFTNPQDAYEAMQAALYEISSNLNDGMAQLIEVRQDVNNISQEIIEEIQ